MSLVQARATEMMAAHGFLGVPLETFEQAGREQLIALLAHGMNPESTVLEFGCGCLRIAYWLVRFLDPGHYCGLEPARGRVELGLQYLFYDEIRRIKQPRFEFNAHFDPSAFGMQFDYVLARSIWSHASKRQIGMMLDAFLRFARPDGVLLTSYLPTESSDPEYQAFLTARFPEGCGPGGYDGDAWVGTSHESDASGVVQHSLAWIVEQCARRGLVAAELPGVDCDRQLWLRIERAR